MVITLRQFVRQLEQVVQQANGNAAMQMLNTPVKDMEEYKRKIGRAEGMTNAVGLAKDMLAQLEEREDQDGLPEMPPGDGKQKASGGKK